MPPRRPASADHLGILAVDGRATVSASCPPEPSAPSRPPPSSNVSPIVGAMYLLTSGDDSTERCCLLREDVPITRRIANTPAHADPTSSHRRRSRQCSAAGAAGLHKPSSYVLVVGFLLLIVASASSSRAHEIHKRMTQTDLRKVFQVHSQQDVPEYDVVHLRVINKRSASDGDAADSSRKHVSLEAFGEKMHLNLKPNADFNDRLRRMKVFTAETTGNGKLKYVEEATGATLDESVGQTYHDDSQMAAVLLRQGSDGKLQMDGTIGSSLVIKPVPSSVSLVDVPGKDDDEIFLDEDEPKSPKSSYPKKFDATFPLPNTNIPKLTSLRASKASLTQKGAHFVFKRKFHEEAPHTDYLELEPGHPDRKADLGLPSFNWTSSTNNSSNADKPHRRSKRQSPDTVWPEVLLVVDYDSYLLHGANSRDVKRYFISFWNGVDLRYKLLSHPRIRVSLAGMIVAKVRCRCTSCTPVLISYRRASCWHLPPPPSSVLIATLVYLHRTATQLLISSVTVCARPTRTRSTPPARSRTWASTCTAKTACRHTTWPS